MYLPYFQFEVRNWLTGNISMHSMCAQGLFINLCALWWKNGGELQYQPKQLAKRFRISVAEFEEYFKELQEDVIILDDGLIEIKFLRELLESRKINYLKRAEAGRMGGKAKYKKMKQVEKKTGIPVKEKRKRRFVPPTIQDVAVYIEEKDLVGVVDPKIFVQYYQEGDWHDQKGSPVKNWKQKLLAVWATPEKRKARRNAHKEINEDKFNKNIDKMLASEDNQNVAKQAIPF